jgi:hypothetical protein
VKDVKQRFSEWQNLAVTLNKGYSKSKKETLLYNIILGLGGTTYDNHTLEPFKELGLDS